MVAWVDTAKATIGELYDPESRPKAVSETLTALGAEKVLGPKAIQTVASVSTVSGFNEQKDALKEIAAPYIAKARDADGRKELVSEVKELANEKVLKPVTEYATDKVSETKEAVKVYTSEKVAEAKEYTNTKVIQPTLEYTTEKVIVAKELASEKVIKPTSEFAAPYIAKSSEIAAPYIAKLETKRAEVVSSKRYETAMTAVVQAKERSLETASELRAKAIDLLKYDNFASYREYVQSEAFQADTMRLIKVELPAIASDAAAKGITTVKTGATTLAAEIDEKRGKIVSALERGYSAARKLELKELRARTKLLVGELQAELSGGVEQVKADGFSLADAIERMKKIVGAIDSILLAPVLAAGEADPTPKGSPQAEVAPTDLPAVPPLDQPSGGCASSDGSEEEKMADCEE